MTQKNAKKAELKARRKPPIPKPIVEATKKERLEKAKKKHHINNDDDLYADLRMEQQEQM